MSRIARVSKKKKNSPLKKWKAVKKSKKVPARKRSAPLRRKKAAKKLRNVPKKRKRKRSLVGEGGKGKDGWKNRQQEPTKAQISDRQFLSKKLPMFSGRMEEWPMFISSYETSTKACGFSDVEILARLQECLKGEALEAVRITLILPKTVPKIIEKDSVGVVRHGEITPC